MSGVLVQWPDLIDAEEFRVERLDSLDAMPYLIARLPGTVRQLSDDTGVDTTVYRVQAYTGGSLAGDTGPFQPSVNKAASLQTRVRLDHNFGGVDAHRYTDVGGNGLGGLTLRLYREPDYLARRYDAALQVTQTDADGRWVAPMFVEPGFTYVLHVSGEGFRVVLDTMVV